jgi:hypothetical protein
MPRPVAQRIVVLGLAAAALVAPEARAGLPRGLQWSAGIGKTTWISGTPDEGGWSGRLAALFAVRERFATGVELSADDMGQRLGALTDPNDGVDLGSVATAHGAVYAASWRVDAVTASHGWGGKYAGAGFASVTGGWYGVRDDRLGRGAGSDNAPGFSAGAGWRFDLPGRISLGPSVRYVRVFSDRTGRWMTVGVDAKWR